MFARQATSAGRLGASARRITEREYPSRSFSDDGSATHSVRRVELVSRDDSTEAVVLYDGAPIAVNLLDLRDGVDTLLTTRSVPAGDYRQIRFLLAGDARVVFSDGRTFPLRVPSGQQTGIKVNLPAHRAAESDTVDVLVDFNVEESFVVRGNPASANFQGFLFKPVLRVERLATRDSLDAV